MRSLPFLIPFAALFSGCGTSPVTVARAAPSGPSPVAIRWVGNGAGHLEGEIKNVSKKPLDNLVVEASVYELRRDRNGNPVTRTTSASVVFERPSKQYQIVSATGRAKTYSSAGGPDTALPPGERARFRLESVDRKLIRRIEVFRRLPGVTLQEQEFLAGFEGRTIR